MSSQDPFAAPETAGGIRESRVRLTEFPIAGDLGSRFVANLVDSVILTIGLGVGLVTIGLFWVLLVGEPTDAEIDAFLSDLPLTIVVMGFQSVYFGVFESSGWHASPGKRLVGLRVVDREGYALSFGAALGRGLAKTTLLSMCGFLALSVMTDDQQRGLWDLIVGTRVIRRPGLDEEELDLVD